MKKHHIKVSPENYILILCTLVGGKRLRMDLSQLDPKKNDMVVFVQHCKHVGDTGNCTIAHIVMTDEETGFSVIGKQNFSKNEQREIEKDFNSIGQTIYFS